MRILDATAGNRAVWFDKAYPDATFIDIRSVGDKRNAEADCRHTPFVDGAFDLVVFDPPHGVIGPNGAMAERYGHYTTREICDLVRDAFVEFHRILRPDGLVAFKWNDHDMKMDRVLAPVTGFDRLVGVPVAMRTKHASRTYWVLLRRTKGMKQDKHTLEDIDEAEEGIEDTFKPIRNSPPTAPGMGTHIPIPFQVADTRLGW